MKRKSRKQKKLQRELEVVRVRMRRGWKPPKGTIVYEDKYKLRNKRAVNPDNC